MDGAQAGGLIGGMLCFLVAALAIWTLVGAVILRAAVALYNKFAGGADSPNGVQDPGFGKAMGIVLVTMIVNFAVGFGIGLVMGGGAAAAGADAKQANLLAQLISVPAGLLVMAGMLTAMLPTTFGRAILVTLCYLLVSILIVVVLVAVVFAVMAGAGVLMR